MKTRYKVLLVLMAAVTVVLLVIQGRAIYFYYHPTIPDLPSGFGLTDILLLDLIYFFPIYAGTWLLWLLGAGLIDWLRGRSR